jgi:hypothetical protein
LNVSLVHMPAASMTAFSIARVCQARIRPAISD